MSTGADVKCVRVRGDATSGLTLAYMDDTMWRDKAMWSAQVGGAGEVKLELQEPCTWCAWRVASQSAWSVAEIRMFTNTDCSSGSAASGHSFASRTRCGGIPLLADGAFSSEEPEWCGEASDWAGLHFGGEADIHCVMVTGILSSLELELWYRTPAAVQSWNQRFMTDVVLSQNASVLTPQ